MHSKDEGIGKDAVAWKNKNNPIFEGNGKTMDLAVRDMMRKVVAKKEALREKVASASSANCSMSAAAVHTPFTNPGL